MIKIKDSSLIDLSKHAVIEASAGTGKTTTLVNLIARLLIEKKACVDEIVVVTFTEKATGELKQRVRNKLNELLKNDDSDKKTKELLKSSEENFDKMLIATIHGFCNRILNEYSFENRESFQKELISDGSLYPKILHKIMRKEWHEVYGDNLENIIELSDFTENGETFEKMIIDIASKYRPECGDKLIPKPQTGIKNIKKNIEYFNQKIKELIELAGSFKTHEECILYKEYFLLQDKTRNDWFTSRLNKILLPFLNFILESKKNGKQIREIKNFLNETNDSTKNQGYSILFKVNPSHKNYNFKNNLPTLYHAVELLEEIRGLFNPLNKQLISDTVHLLKPAMDNYKKENSLMSFDDMLRQVNDSLSNESFLRILQKKYKYALVDEFQDTDRIQWEIFKKVFLNNKNKLIVVGDPKQSIYGFRNADVNIYIEAKDEMTTKHNAPFYLLNTNYRSSKKLINDFNIFFKTGEWFANEAGKNIDYQEAETPFDESKSNTIIFNDEIRDNTGVNIINIGKSKAGKALLKLSALIVGEIKYLLNNKNKIIFKNNDKDLTEGDICIIVRKSREAEFIEEVLARNNIKASFYKKTGLFQSREALNLKYLLNSLTDPNDISSFKKALLTDFFGIKLQDINMYAEINVESKLKQTYEKWIILAEKREWSKLFQSVLYDTGLYLRLVKNEEKTLIDSERAITNYRHIFEILEKEAAASRFDIYKLNEHLTGLINNSIFTEINGDLHRLETEAHRVKIMTVHASKGLEFPIVFLFGGFTSGPHPAYYKFHDEDNSIIYDLTKNDKNKDLHKNEEMEEAKRLYYVTFTRAKHKLYVPYFEPENNSRINDTAKKLNETINDFFKNDYFLEKSSRFDAASTDNPQSIEKNRKEKIGVDKLFPLINSDAFNKRKITIQSFSSINARLIYEMEDETSKSKFGESDKEKDESTAIVEDEREENDLPGGTGTGLMFHAIFENIDFEDVNIKKCKSMEALKENEKIKNIAAKYFNIYFEKISKDTTIKDIYFNKIIQIIHTTLNTPLGAGNIILSELKTEERIHEIEFYLPAMIDKDMEAFINGFIDMVFKYNGKYYLLDWKSNYLSGGYAGERFYKEVEQHYALQYKIYYIAFIEWLKKRSENFNYNEHFGGIFYLYLRGMGNNQNGIFHYRPEQNKYETIKKELIDFVMQKIID